MENEKDTRGVNVEKDEFSEWFTQLMLKAKLADYTSVSGAIVFRPGAYAIWEKIVFEVDKRFKKLGIKNAYFPLLIPERTLAKEQEHIRGFSPEVAWVTHAGNSRLSEKLAIRPTSETIMYESYSKWIRSWRDLPLKINQWNNVVRWEFKNPIPFLRTREFLWNEGHTVYATKKEAENEKNKIIEIYDEVCRKFLALPSLIGRKSEKEKFAGAEYTVSMEFLMPNGKAIQGPDFHHDGQKFARAYDIKFLNKNGKEEYAWQNTFAITTRILGIMFAVHSDSKGLVLPPKITNKKIVIVPILFDDSKRKVLKVSKEIERDLKSFGAFIDERDNYKPGFKFNEWELKGVPLRIEVGPKDIDSGKVVIVRRDNGGKERVALNKLSERTGELLDKIQSDLLKKAEKLLKDSVVNTLSLDDVKKVIKNKKIAFAPLCNMKECEDNLKFKSGGAKVLNIPEEQNGHVEKCVVCGQDGIYWGYIGRSY